jgi:hypothetical protein
MQQMVDEAGNIWNVDAQGNPVSFAGNANQQRGGGVQIKPADPTLNAEIRKKNADAAKAEADAAVAGPMARAQLLNAQTNAASISKPSATEIELAAKEAASAKRAATVRALTDQVRRLYKQDIQGQPASRLWGATEYIDMLPANERFTAAGNTMLPLIRPLIAQTAKEGDSNIELTIFQSYVPSANDSDKTIEQKLAMLDILIGGMVDGSPPSKTVNDLNEGQIVPPKALQYEGYVGNETGFFGPDGPVDNPPPSGGGGDGAPRDTLIGAADAFGRNFANAGTLGMADKFSAAANALIPLDALGGADVRSVWDGSSFGQAYDSNMALNRRMNAADREVNPVSSFAGDVGGSVAGMMGANGLLRGLGAGGLVSRTGGAAGDVLYGTARGGVENGAQGAAVGGAAALGGNLIGRYVLAPGARAVADTRAGRAAINASRKGGRALANAGRGLFGQAPRPVQPVNIPPPLPRGERTAMARLPDDAEAQLNEAASMGLPMAIADLSPELQMLTGSAVRKSTVARDMAENTLRPRALGQADRAQEQIARNFGAVDNPNEISDQLLQQARQNAAPLYDAFRAQPARVSGELTAMLQTPAGSRALANARNIAANEGRDPNAMGFDLDQQGNVILRSDPSPETLDLVKRGFDDVISDYRDPTSGRLNLNDQGRAIEGLRQRFVGEVDRLYPNYADARRAYAGPAGEREALQTGRDMANAHPRDIAPRMQGMTPGQQDQFRLGQRVAMSDAVDRARLTTNPYERVYGSPVAQARAATVFGAGPAANFGRAHQIEGNMSRTAQEALGGSPTAARIAADEAFDGMMGDVVEAGGSLLTGGGGLGGLVERASRGLRDNIRLRGGEQRGAELAPLLLNTDPAAMSALIARLRQASALRNDYVQRTRKVGGLFGASLGGAAALPVQ